MKSLRFAIYSHLHGINRNFASQNLWPMDQPVFRTIINIEPSPVKLNPRDAIFSIGSCFADEVSSLMRRGLLSAYASPFGTVYNPQSIAFQINRIVNESPATPDEVVLRDGSYVSLMAHSCITAESESALLAAIDHHTHEAHNQLTKAKFVLITLGTAFVFVNKNGHIVANCQKQPAHLFDRQLLPHDKIVAHLRQIISDIRSVNAEARIIFTVSPIRHLADGLAGNSLSKALLRTAVASVVGDAVDYFPAFEILTDDLRDYRFYASDMVHPSPEAVRYVYNHFADAYFAPQTIDFVRDAEKITAMLEHRPMNVNVNNYLEYLSKIEYRLSLLIKHYSDIQDVWTIIEVQNQIKNLKCKL